MEDIVVHHKLDNYTFSGHLHGHLNPQVNIFVNHRRMREGCSVCLCVYVSVCYQTSCYIPR